MIQKIEKAAIQLRFVFLGLFIAASIIAAICYADEQDEERHTDILALWPPDMVPHPHPPSLPKPPKPPGPDVV